LDVVSVNKITKKFSIGKPVGNSKIIKHWWMPTEEKKILALDNVTFDVKQGEILGIIGFNGSGKTTLLRTIAGVYRPDSGSVKVNGTLSPLLQLGAGFQVDLNARENIIMNGMLLGMSKSFIEKKLQSIIEYAGLENFSDLKIKHYSTGMRARLAFSIGMQIEPDILLIDEILSVGDKDFREKSYKTFLTFKKNKKTIIHATHNLEKLKEFSDRVLLLNKGKIISIGNPDEVIKKYMGIKSEDKIR